MLLLGLVQLGCVSALVILLLVAALRDFRTLRIANWVSLAICGFFALWAGAGLSDGQLSTDAIILSIGCSAAVFLAGVAAFAAGAMGGGDVKLLAAVSLFAGPSLVASLLIVTALAGGGLAVAVLAGAPIGPALPTSDGTATHGRLGIALPYGLAIAAGGLWTAVKLLGL